MGAHQDELRALARSFAPTAAAGAVETPLAPQPEAPTSLRALGRSFEVDPAPLPSPAAEIVPAPAPVVRPATGRGVRPPEERTETAFDFSALSPELPQVVTDFLRGANTPLADLLDLPGALGASALRTAGFDVDDPAIFRTLGAESGLTSAPGVAPKGRAEAVGEMFGIGATVGPAFVGGLAKLGTIAPRLPGAIGRGAEILGRAGRQIIESAFGTPKTFFALEAAMATTAGLGGFEVAEMFPDSPAAKAIGQIIGGLSPAGAIVAVKSAPTAAGLGLFRKWVIKPALEPFSGKGGLRRARQRVERAIEDEGAALAKLVEADVLKEAGLTPAQKIGEPRLLALERSIIATSDELVDKAASQLARAYAAARTELSGLGEGVPLERTRETLEAIKQTFKSLLDVRMDIAVRKADERIVELGPQVNRQAANEIVKEELEVALKAGIVQEQQLYLAIPQELDAPLLATRNVFAKILLLRRKGADPADIPAFVTKALGSIAERTSRKGNVVRFLKGGLFGETQPIGEAIVFRSRLLRELAAERAKPGASGEKKKLLNDLQTAIVDEDFAALQRAVDPDARVAIEGAARFSGEFAALAGKESITARDTIDAARGFSELLNTRFRQGMVGELLGTKADRGPKTVAGLTLERTLVRGGPVGRETADALEQAIRFGGDQPRMQAAIEDFLKSEFLRKSLVGGRLDVKKAEAFLKQFDEVLDRYPTLRSDLEGAHSSGEFRDLTMRRLKGISDALESPKVSKAAIFLNAPVDRELVNVVKSAKPGATMAKLVRQAKRDPSGDALKGLKTGYIDFLLRGAEGRISPITNAPKVSGTKMVANRKQKGVRAMENSLLSPGERRRLDTIINTLVKAEAAETSPQAVEGIIGDIPGAVVTLVTRLVGTAIGRFGSRQLGFGGTVQAPGLAGKYLSDALSKGVADPARRLLIAMVDDEKLFRALFTEISDPKDLVFVRQQLDAWLAGVVAEIAGGEEQEEED